MYMYIYIHTHTHTHTPKPPHTIYTVQFLKHRHLTMVLRII